MGLAGRVATLAPWAIDGKRWFCSGISNATRPTKAEIRIQWEEKTNAAFADCRAHANLLHSPHEPGAKLHAKNRADQGGLFAVESLLGFVTRL
jgi:hypothetical protein